jgi:type I restriction enzyme, S subunit
MNNISLEDVRLLRLLIPPFAEQQRIVRKLKELSVHTNSARARLLRVNAILKRFRQAVLAAACSGRLTEDWRDSHRNIETAPELFARISKRHWTNGENSKIRQVDTEALPILPKEWIWVYLSDLGYMSRGKSRHRPRDAEHLYNGPYPFIQTGDIAQSKGRIASHRQTYSEAGLQQSRLWPAGTVCITIAANIAHSAILAYPACFPDSVVGVIPEKDLCRKEYLEFFIRTARNDLEQYAPATAQKNINIAILEDVAVPLPPLCEQQEIVNRVETLLNDADRIEARVSHAAFLSLSLTQSILAKAFRGKLVPTEAELARREARDYEPASVLLERIKQERELPTAKQSRTRQRQRTSA